MKERILHVITLSQWGGAQQVCYDIILNLNKDKFSVEVACAPGGELVNRLREQGIVVHTIESLKREVYPLNDLRALFALYRLIRKERYDIVHCHSTKAGLLGRIAAWLARTPKIYFTVHGWGFYNVGEYGRLRPILIFLEKLAARLTDKIICVSENDKKQGMKKKIASKDKFVVIHNGINWNQTKKSENLRKEIGAGESDVIFGMVGRLAYQKNPLLFLEAAGWVAQTHKQAKFVLVGNGVFYGDCRKFIDKNHLEKCAFMLGFRKDVPELLSNMDVFVLSSRFEGLPLTIIEAMFAGLPIVATDVGGVSELVHDQENGFLVQPDSAEELAAKMIYLIENPGERISMGKKSERIAKGNFTIDRMVQKYEKLYMQ